MGEGKDKIGLSAEQRYLNQSWGVIYGQDGAETATRTARTTATSSLGHLITRSSFYGAAVQGRRHHFGPCLTHFPALHHHPSRAVWSDLLGGHACGMLIGACDPMV